MRKKISAYGRIILVAATMASCLFAAACADPARSLVEKRYTREAIAERGKNIRAQMTLEERTAPLR